MGHSSPPTQVKKEGGTSHTVEEERHHKQHHRHHSSSKRKKSSAPSQPAVKIEELENDEIQFEIPDVVSWMTENPPGDLFDARDEELCRAILLGTERQNLLDMVTCFLNNQNIFADEKDSWKPSKFHYSKNDPYNSFDYYSRNGCLNCGSSIDLNDPSTFSIESRLLICKACAKPLCPLHFDVESDSLADRPTGQKTSTTPEAADKSLPGCVYLRGTRYVHDFGQNSKEWWQSYYLPKETRNQDVVNIMRASALVSTMKAPTVKEICDICGNDTAFYHSFQARSADEGMTIMYECCKCHARKTFNN